MVCRQACRQIRGPPFIYASPPMETLTRSDPIRAGRVAAWVFMLLTTLFALWALGPRPSFVESWNEPELPEDLDGWLADREAGVPALREGDERGIIWVDPDARTRTDLSIVYLHGFSADRHEVEPVISMLGAELQANVFFARLAGHGRHGPAMAEATVEAWFSDAAEAVAVASRIGERIVLIGTSTGGTLATWISARPEVRDRLAALILVSPNFQPKDRNSRIFLQPWGEQIASLVVGSERCWEPLSEAQQRHWTTCYPISAVTPMMALVERVRTMDLSAVTIPTLVLYSSADQVVDAAETSVRLATMTSAVIRTADVPSATDPSHHLLAGDIASPESSADVRRLMAEFLREHVTETIVDTGGHPDE